MFATRHYTAIASLLNQSMGHADLFDQPAVLHLIETFADYLQLDNPRFNRDRFLRACGLVVTPKLMKGQ